jgi:hypothetical protein
MPEGGRQHHPERLARDQLVARLVWQILAPGEEILDGHPGVMLGGGRGHR